jgi:hypothetical protein
MPVKNPQRELSNLTRRVKNLRIVQIPIVVVWAWPDIQPPIFTVAQLVGQRGALAGARGL